jgi:hypothetical protein
MALIRGFYTGRRGIVKFIALYADHDFDVVIKTVYDIKVILIDQT